MRRLLPALACAAACGGGAATPDASAPDGRAPDATATDARPVDGGALDAALPDAQSVDAALDAAALDAAAVDAAVLDAAGLDAAGALDASTMDAGPSVNTGFVTPSAPTHAFVGTVDVGLADWNCHGQAPTQTNVNVTLSGRAADFQYSGNAIQGATVELFVGTDLTAVDTAGPTGATGAYALTIPSATARFGLSITATNFMRTLSMQSPLLPDVVSQTRDALAVSNGVASALPAIVGIVRTPGTIEAAATVVDCQGRKVANAIATVSDVPSSAVHRAGAQTYFLDAGTGLPVRHDHLAATDRSGLFMVIQAAAGAPGYLQVWGRPDAASGLELLAELPIPMPSDSVVTATMTP